MKGDGHIGGEMYRSKPRMFPQQKSSRANKKFPILDVPLLHGEPIMCVFIFAGLRDNKKVEMGIDPMAEEVANIDNEDYAINNMEKGK